MMSPSIEYSQKLLSEIYSIGVRFNTMIVLIFLFIR